MRYFADTSFWLALLSRKDAYRDKALLVRQQVGSDPIVTTNLVLVEVLNSCCRSELRLTAGQLFERCLSDAQIQVIWGNPDLTRRGLTLYLERQDKAWSLTDCISFLVMQDGEIQDALTSDHHFVQAGFRTLLT